MDNTLAGLCRSGVAVATGAGRWLMPLVFVFLVSAALVVAESRALVQALAGDALQQPVDVAVSADTAVRGPAELGACAYYVALNGTMPVMYGCSGSGAAVPNDSH